MGGAPRPARALRSPKWDRVRSAESFSADGRTITGEKADDEGGHTRPLSWDQVRGKFDRLTAGRLDSALGRCTAEAVGGIAAIAVRDLTALLARVPAA